MYNVTQFSYTSVTSFDFFLKGEDLSPYYVMNEALDMEDVADITYERLTLNGVQGYEFTIWFYGEPEPKPQPAPLSPVQIIPTFVNEYPPTPPLEVKHALALDYLKLKGCEVYGWLVNPDIQGTEAWVMSESRAYRLMEVNSKEWDGTSWVSKKMVVVPEFTPLPLNLHSTKISLECTTKHLMGLSVLEQMEGISVYGLFKNGSEYLMGEKMAYNLLMAYGYRYNGVYWSTLDTDNEPL